MDFDTAIQNLHTLRGLAEGIDPAEFNYNSWDGYEGKGRCLLGHMASSMALYRQKGLFLKVAGFGLDSRKHPAIIDEESMRLVYGFEAGALVLDIPIDLASLLFSPSMRSRDMRDIGAHKMEALERLDWAIKELVYRKRQREQNRGATIVIYDYDSFDEAFARQSGYSSAFEAERARVRAMIDDWATEDALEAAKVNPAYRALDRVNATGRRQRELPIQQQPMAEYAATYTPDQRRYERHEELELA